MNSMMNQYRLLHSEERGVTESENLSYESLRRHITRLLADNRFTMRLPKVVDVRRCISRETLVAWYNLPDVIRLLASPKQHPSLIFNADETEINRKGSAPGSVAGLVGQQPCVVVKDLTTSHVSLFLAISAAGMSAPCVVLHGKPNVFVKRADLLPQLRFFRTANGYMDKVTLMKIVFR